MLGYTTMRGNSLQFLHSVHWKLTLPFWLHLKPCFMKGNSSRLSPQRPWQVQTARSQGRPRKTPEVDSIHQVFVFCHAMTVMVTTQRIQRQRHYGKDNSKDTKKKTIWQRQPKGNESKDNMTGGIRTIPVPEMTACSCKRSAALSLVANLRKTTFCQDDFNDCDDGPVCTFVTLQNEIIIFIFWTLSRLTLWRGCGCRRTHNL